MLAEQQQLVVAALHLACGLQTGVRDLRRVDHPTVFTGAVPPCSATVSMVMPRGVGSGGGRVRLQERLTDVTDGGGRGGVGVRDGDQELHVFVFFSGSSLLGRLSPASSCLQLVKWTVIGPGLLLLVQTGSC